MNPRKKSFFEETDPEPNEFANTLPKQPEIPFGLIRKAKNCKVLCIIHNKEVELVAQASMDNIIILESYACPECRKEHEKLLNQKRK